ncbi:MAG TPA: hypothetical protein VJR89_20085, partial [Polyangiales bacterium]|nr:hypothetical protein [Polyangiales bacterium]
MAVLATSAGCSSVSPPAAEVCIAGEVWSCDCGDMRNAGRRRCRGDGTFGACECKTSAGLVKAVAG